MVNIDSLINALPISGLEPAWIAFISGLAEAPHDRPWEGSVRFFEPPAGARVPYIDPIEAIETLLRGQGIAAHAARSSAQEAVAGMTNGESALNWIKFFDCLESEPPDCMPVTAFVEWLRKQWPQACRPALDRTRDSGVVSAPPGPGRPGCLDIADFFERAADVVARAPMLRGPDNWHSPYSLMDKPAVPPPKAMIDFFPGAPWSDIDEVGDSETVNDSLAAFLRWREDIRPVAQVLEKSLGQPVYYFADLGDELDDDCVHRFLLLHWCCSWKPESKFVKYLIGVSGARDVGELKGALIDPASYHHAFEMNDAFFGIDPIPCRFEYTSGERKTVGVVFATSQAQEAAYFFLQQQIGTEALIVAPPELLDRAWIDRAAANCHGWSAWHMTSQTIEESISILTQVDRLYVIADEQERSPAAFDLQLSESVEDLLWLAIQHNMDARYCTPDRMGLANPEMSLERRGVPERVTARLAQKSEFTQRLKAIRVYCDYCSSGLWDESGRMLAYDDLDLPVALIRRIAAWQKDFDETEMPPSRSDDAWWQRHEQEQLNIVRALRAALNDRVKVTP